MKDSIFDVRAAAALAALCLQTQACVSVKAEVPEMSVTRSDLSFDPVPAALAGVQSSTSQSFHYQHASTGLPDSVRSNVQATEVSIAANSGVRDLWFVRDLLVTVKDDADATGTSEVLLSYTRSDSDTPSAVLTLPVKGAAASLDPLSSKQFTYTVTVAGALPTVPWSIDVTVHYRGNFEYSP